MSGEKIVCPGTRMNRRTSFSSRVRTPMTFMAAVFFGPSFAMTQAIATLPTIADGIAVKKPGELTMGILSETLDDIVHVEGRGGGPDLGMDEGQVVEVQEVLDNELPVRGDVEAAGLQKLACVLQLSCGRDVVDVQRLKHLDKHGS